MTSGSAPLAEARDLDDRARCQAPGLFVRLKHGYTHYQTDGPRDARTVVLVHGFSVPSFIWDTTFRALAAAGFHVVRYDLFGRGFSDRPDTAYGMPLYLEQLQNLLDSLRIQEVDVVGLSMGGPIAATFCITHPARVGRLVLIGPSGARPIPLGPLFRLAVHTGIADTVLGILGSGNMLNTMAEHIFDPEHVSLFRERYRTQTEFRGFRRAILSSIKSGMLGSFADAYESLGRLHKRILVIWGEDDRTVPFENSRRLRQLLPDAQFLPVKACGHIPHVEQPDLVHRRIIEFLN